MPFGKNHSHIKASKTPSQVRLRGCSCFVVQFKNDFAGCQKCCNDSWANAGYETDEHNLTLFNNCMDACEKLNDAGPSLAPLGSTLWLLPFILGYAAVRRYKINKINK